jgi:hypothetical protein
VFRPANARSGAPRTENFHALIYHWWGAQGKKMIQQHCEVLNKMMGLQFSFEENDHAKGGQVVTFDR